MKAIFHINPDLDRENVHSNYYSSAKDALNTVSAKNAEEIELLFYKGYHICNIKVDKSISIIGKSGNANDVKLKASINNSGGKLLKIKDVTIEKSINFGILQIGGSLEMQNVIVHGIKRSRIIENTLVRNAGINLLSGAKLIASNVSLVKNSLTALLVDGINTKAVISDFIVKDNIIPMHFITDPPQLYGAIEVTNNGTLCIENSIIENNEYIGISVHDGGKIHLRNTTVSGTKLVKDSSGNMLFGDNILTATDSIAELHNFLVSTAQLCGIEIDKAYVTAENGKINNNQIGITFLSDPVNNPDYNPFDCIYDNVELVDNGLRVQSLNGVPIQPVSIDGTPITPDRSNCRLVPWG